MTKLKVWARVGVEVEMEVNDPNDAGAIVKIFQETMNNMKLPKNVEFHGEAYIPEEQVVDVDQNQIVYHHELPLDICNVKPE